MEIIIKSDAHAAARLAARKIATLVRKKPEAVLGLATGLTPLETYERLAEIHRTEGLDFSRVTTFNLDEYVGVDPSHPASYHACMQTTFFSKINLDPGRVHLPDGRTVDVPRTCREYEDRIRAAGGIDLQLLGIGSDGHLGFNEPSSSLVSRTRIKTLTDRTRKDNAAFFDGEENVPHHVITMGLGTIMDARVCLLLAFGRKKAEAIAQAVEGPVTAMVPASILQMHPTAIVIVDEEAAAELKRADYYRWVYDHKPAWQKD
ncbi:MAG: glucosamine-6-phosphate deaminase [Candidatus Aminicenantales bacterium]